MKNPQFVLGQIALKLDSNEHYFLKEQLHLIIVTFQRSYFCENFIHGNERL